MPGQTRPYYSNWSNNDAVLPCVRQHWDEYQNGPRHRTTSTLAQRRRFICNLLTNGTWTTN